MVSSCSNTGSIRDDPYGTSRQSSLELTELSSINKVSLVYVSSCSNTGSIRDDLYWTSRKNSLGLSYPVLMKSFCISFSGAVTHCTCVMNAINDFRKFGNNMALPVKLSAILKQTDI
jgi:hypothetical protein